MPLRGSRTFSLVKSKKNSEDACVLRVVRPIEDSIYTPSVSYNRTTNDDVSYRERSFSLNNPLKPFRWAPSATYSTIGHSDNSLKALIEDEAKLKKEKGSVDSQSFSSEDQENMPQNSDSPLLTEKESSPVQIKDLPQSKYPLGLRKHQRHKSLSSVSPPTFNLQPPDSEYDPYKTVCPLRVIEEQQNLLFSGNYPLVSGRSQKSIEEELLKAAKSVASLEILKDFHSASRNGVAGSKKTEKIQKNTRSLYDGNNVKKLIPDKNRLDTDQLRLKFDETDLNSGDSRLGDYT